jgi:hypothetical protein
MDHKHVCQDFARSWKESDENPFDAIEIDLASTDSTVHEYHMSLRYLLLY